MTLMFLFCFCFFGKSMKLNYKMLKDEWTEKCTAHECRCNECEIDPANTLSNISILTLVKLCLGKFE